LPTFIPSTISLGKVPPPKTETKDEPHVPKLSSENMFKIDKPAIVTEEVKKSEP
jgi:hypothetical protein